MTTKRAAIRTVEEEILNEKVPIGGHVLANPPVIQDGEVKEDFLNLNQVMDTQDQYMRTHENTEVRPCVHKNSNTMASHLTDFTTMLLPIFFGSKVNKDLLNILDKVYKILFSMG